MRHGAVAAQFLITEVAGSADPIALIDFENENYLYFGSPVAVSDLLEEDDVSWGDYNVINIIAGLGLKAPGESPTGSDPVFKDPLLSLMLAGCTIVFDYHMGGGGITLLFADFPDYNNDWNFDVPVGFAANIFNSYDAADAASAETNPDNTDHRIAVTFISGKYALSTDGGAVDLAHPGDPATPFTDIALAIAGTDLSPFYMRSITVYEPQLDAMLPILSAIPASDDLAGVAALSIASTATLVAASALAGTATLSIVSVAALSADSALTGSANITLSVEADLNALADGDIAGIVSLSLAPSATLIADAPLVGSASISLSTTGTVIDTNTDANWANVVLLTGFERRDGDAALIDERNGRTITFTGNAQIDTGIVIDGTSSLLLDGTGDGVELADNADWDLSNANSDPFTIEVRVRVTTTTPGNRRFLSQAATSNVGWIFGLDASDQIEFLGSIVGAAFDWSATPLSTGLTWSTGTTYEIAVDKDSSGKVRIYRDGTMVGSATPANSALFNTTTPLIIGADSTYGRAWPGSMDEVRITKGVARYASDGGYTPTGAPWPRMSPFLRGTPSTITGTGVTSVSLPYARTLVDDIMIISANFAGTGVTITTPTGFTQIGTTLDYGTDAAGDTLHSAVFWKRADGTETGNITLTKSGAAGAGAIFYGVMAAYAGCTNSGSPIDANSETTDASQPYTMSSITTTGAYRRVVCVFNIEDNDGRGGASAGPATGWINRVAHASNVGNDGSIFIDDIEQVAAGSPANDFYGSGISQSAGVHAFALKK